MKQKWDERYQEVDFAYGKEPNEFFEHHLAKFQPGSILMPADGEGRNGVFAARLGWNVTSFDQSIEGEAKALKLAEEVGTKLNYVVGDFNELEFENASFDAIGLIYAHFPGNLKSKFHLKLDRYLKSGGVVIFEAFSKSHLSYRIRNPKVGGPEDIEMLYSLEEIKSDFANYEFLVLEETVIELNEGKYHNGQGAVIRFIGVKK